MRNIKILGFLLFISLCGLWSIKRFGQQNKLNTLPEVKWSSLASAKPDLISEELEVKLKNPSRIAGFVVPLSDSLQRINEFLLVPDSMSCIHVPPPPSNQMIFVHFENPIEPQLAFGPVWVSGIISFQQESHLFGTALYSMTGTQIVPYRSNSSLGSR